MTDKGHPLAHRVVSWMRQMSFRPMGTDSSVSMPTERDIESICVGNMADILQFLVENTAPSHVVEAAQRARSMKDVDENEEKRKAEEDEKRESLVCSLNEVKDMIAATESEIQNLQMDVEKQSKLLEEKRQTNLEQGVRDVLKKAYSVHTAEFVDKLSEYEKSLQSLVERTKLSSKKGSEAAQVYFADKGEDTGRDALNPPLEGGHVRIVRSACNETASEMYRQMMACEKSDDAFNEQFTLVTDSLDNHDIAPTDVLDALLELTKGSSNIMSTAITRARLTDGDDESGMNEDTPESAVEKVLDDRREEHSKLFFQSEELLNEAAELEERVVELAKVIEKSQALHGEASKDDVLSIARSRGAITYVESTKDLIKEIRIEKEGILGTQQNLQSQLYRIKELEATKDKNHSLIRRAVNKNARLRKQFTDVQKDLVDFSTDRILPERAALEPYADRVNGEMAEENVSFNSAKLSNFLHSVTPTSGILGSTRSEYPFVDELFVERVRRKLDRVRKLFDNLSLPSYCSADRIHSSVSQRNREAALSRRDAERIRILHRDMTSHPLVHETSKESMSGIVRDAKDLRKRMESVLLPSLNSCDDSLKEAHLDADRVDRIADEWLNEPVKDSVPYYRVDGMNFQEWKEQHQNLQHQLRSTSS